MLRIRLPDGTTLTRRFLRTTTCAEVFAWLAACVELEALDDQWTLTLPAALHARALDGGLLPTDETLEELDLCGVTLFVQDESA